MHLPLQLATTHLPIGSLDAYIHQANQIPLLTVEEERDCAQRFHEVGDIEAARHLVLAHLRYVVRVARGYLGYGLPLNDLIQEGNIGLMKAVKRFDPTLGVRLVSFAVHWIKSEIHEFVLKNWRIVKVATTKAQRKLFFNLRQMKKRLGWCSAEEINAVAEDLGVTPKDVRVMEMRLNAMDSSWDGDDVSDNDTSTTSQFVPARYLSDASADPAYIIEQADDEHQESEKLQFAMTQLDGRSQDILKQRWLQDEKAITLHALAEKYSISAERVRQLEKNAMQKLRKYLEN
ncbi:MAG: RNA polymerase sigma factor RpoH [Gammaproteobacteria bacterium]|nr:RNA polymerase sigma factor RpoH [Gammaproteobacteria bacterium]MCH9763616.1 RNA polymerase sigma factor RpoH [Gammaproteobacteria bacterium]